MLRRLLSYFLCLLVFSGVAQSRKRNFRQRELGFFAGGSYYIGDINPRGHFKASHPAGGVFFRYSTNYRFAFRFGLNAGTISGNDADSGEPDQIERNLSFTSKIYELNTIAEFNFVEYRIGHDKHNFTMYIFGGLATYNFNPIGGSGQELRTLNTEGQSEPYSRTKMSIPFGVGLKINIGDKCGLGLEWGPRYTWTDYLDDIKGTYAEGSVSTADVTATRVTNEPGNMRGNPSTKDWYFYYGLSLNIKLREPHRQCHKEF